MSDNVRVPTGECDETPCAKCGHWKELHHGPHTSCLHALQYGGFCCCQAFVPPARATAATTEDRK